MAHEGQLAPRRVENARLLAVDAVTATGQRLGVPVLDLRLAAVVHNLLEVKVGEGEVSHTFPPVRLTIEYQADLPWYVEIGPLFRQPHQRSTIHNQL